MLSVHVHPICICRPLMYNACFIDLIENIIELRILLSICCPMKCYPFECSVCVFQILFRMNSGELKVDVPLAAVESDGEDDEQV